MAKVKFFLKDSNSDKDTLIYLVINYDKKRLKYSTGEHIHPKAWDFEKHSPLSSLKFPYNQAIIQILEQYRHIIIDELGEIRRLKKPFDPKILREILDTEFKQIKNIEKENEAIKRETLFEYINRYIDECKKGKRLTPKGKKYKDWTIKGYTTLLYHLTQFSATTKKSLNFEEITLDFYFDFLDYFHRLNHATNTIGKHIKNIKVIMAAAADEEIHNNMEFRKKRFRIITEETDAIYLSEQELDLIYNYDFSKNKKLERVRDSFIVAARTGLRFSDLNLLREHHFFKHNGKDFIRIKTEKTDVNVVIPLRPEIIELYQKYDGKLPRVLSNQKMNEYLKQIGELAGMDNITTKSITKGGLGIEIKFKKFELLTTHTARRSFATNCFLAGIPAISIMKITGHKTERAFLKYIRMSAEDNAYKLADHDYFSGKNTNLKIVG